MRKRSVSKKVIVRTLTSPLAVVVNILSIFIMVYLRAHTKAQKLHSKIEWHEKGNYYEKGK